MIKKLVSAIREDNLWSLFVRLGTAGVGSQLLALMVYPLISRLYGPEDFGIRATFAALYMLILPFSTLNLEFALPMVKQRSEAGNVFNTSMIVTVLLAVMLLMLVGGIEVTGIIQHPVRPFLWILPLAIFLGGFRKALLGWASWLAHRRALVRSKYWRAGTKSTVELVGGFWQANIWLLVSSQAIGILAMIIYLNREMSTDIRALIQQTKYTSWKDILNRYRAYPLYTLPSTFADIFNTHFPLLFFGAFLSLEFTGQFSMAILLIYLVFSSLGDAFSQAYLVELGKFSQQEHQDIRALFKRSLLNITLSTALITIGIALLGKPFLVWILGSQWITAAAMVPVLSLLVPVYFWTALCFHTLNKLSKQGLIFLLHLLRALFLLVLFLLFYQGESSSYDLVRWYVANTFVFGLLFLGSTYYFVQKSALP